MSISASAVLSLQTRINNERSRRGLSSAGFTGGVTSGSNIRAPHINELRSYTETLNTMGSVSFGWSGNVAAGADITDALSQISSYCTTLENEALASWHSVPVNTDVVVSGVSNVTSWSIPAAAQGVNGAVRYKHTVGATVLTAQEGCTGGADFGNITALLANSSLKSSLLSSASNNQIFNYWTYAEIMGVASYAGFCSFAEAGTSGTGITNGGYTNIYDAGAQPYASSFLMTRGILQTDPQSICNSKSVSSNLNIPHNYVNGSKDVIWHGHGKATQQNTWRYLAHANTVSFSNFMIISARQIESGVSASSFTVEAYY